MKDTVYALLVMQIAICIMCVSVELKPQTHNSVNVRKTQLSIEVLKNESIE